MGNQKCRWVLVLFVMFLFLAVGGCKSKLEEYKEAFTGNKYIPELEAEDDTDEEINAGVDVYTIFEEKVSLDVNLIYQNPELPTGCEITSLAIVLNHMGINVDKCDLADNYLEKYVNGRADFNNVFCGEPRSDGGYGCYANVIFNASQLYINKNNLSLNYKTKDLTNCEFETIYSYLTDGYPVVAWTTNWLEEPYINEEWEYNGKWYEWLVPEHCVVIIGYDIINNIINIADPQNGYLEQDLTRFIEVWEKMGSQAVTVEYIGR